MSQQSLRQASIRAVTSTTYTYQGDWHALWDLLGIAAGQFNERMLLYINNQLGTSYTEINGAMAAFAAEHGSTTFQAIGTFTPGFSLTAPLLTIESDTSTAVLVLKLIIDDDVPLGYKIQTAVSANADMSSPIETDTVAIGAPDLPSEGGDGQIDDAPFSALPSGTYYVRGVILDASDNEASNYSNTDTITLVISSDPVDYVELEAGGGYIELEAGSGYIQQEAA